MDNGYQVVIYHPRGNQSDLIVLFEPLNKLKFPKEGYLDLNKDFDFAVQYVKKKCPKLHLFAIGHSYGANVLTNVKRNRYTYSLVFGHNW